VDCLSKLWREPANTISGYLGESGLVGSHAECGNCGERQDVIGRQSQTWVRFPGLGWKVVSAHVSAMSAPPPR
jgi:AtzH-like